MNGPYRLWLEARNAATLELVASAAMVGGDRLHCEGVAEHCAHYLQERGARDYFGEAALYSGGVANLLSFSVRPVVEQHVAHRATRTFMPDTTGRPLSFLYRPICGTVEVSNDTPLDAASRGALTPVVSQLCECSPQGLYGAQNGRCLECGRVVK